MANDSTTTQQLGQKGEELAVTFLRGQGYRILEKNYRIKIGEIDIIARDRDTICFVEVKSRNSPARGIPQEAVTSFKRRKMTQVAWWYLKDKNSEGKKARFDVVAIVYDPLTPPQLQLFKNAFDVEYR